MPVSPLRWWSDEPRTQWSGWCIVSEGIEIIRTPIIEGCAEGQDRRAKGRAFNRGTSGRHEASRCAQARSSPQGGIAEGRCKGS